MANVINYNKWGGKRAGMLVNKGDLEYRPLSSSRSGIGWLNGKESISTLDSQGLEEAILIPYKVWLKLLEEEKDKELGVDLIKRIEEIDITKSVSN